MDQPNTEQRGDFVAFLNRDKQPGDNRPIFEGKVAKPGSEQKVPLTLWAHAYVDKRTGEEKTMYAGTIGVISPDADPQEQIAALTRGSDPAEQSLGGLTLKARQVVLFPNGFKDDAPDKKRPDLWGAINFGDGSPVARTSVWLGKTRGGQPMLSGATNYPIPGKSEAEMQLADGGMQDLLGSAPSAKTTGDKRKRGGRE